MLHRRHACVRYSWHIAIHECYSHKYTQATLRETSLENGLKNSMVGHGWGFGGSNLVRMYLSPCMDLLTTLIYSECVSTHLS